MVAVARTREMGGPTDAPYSNATGELVTCLDRIRDETAPTRPPAAPRTRRGRARGGEPAGSEGVEEAEDEEGDADRPVHGEERRVQPPEVARADEVVLVGEERRDRDHAEPVEDADREPEPGEEEEGDRRHVQHPGAGEDRVLAEAHRPRVQPLAAVDLDVVERVEEVEAGDPRRHRAAERPRLPRQV